MPDHLRALVVVTFWAHLRLGEVVALRRGDVDSDAGTLHVQRQEVETDNGPLETPPKAASVRTVSLPAPAIDALAEHLAIATRASPPGARLFTRPDADPCAPTTSTTPGRPLGRLLACLVLGSTTYAMPG